jgi:hypothetical protein
MDRGNLIVWMTCLGTLCWPVCFFWMHLISRRQNRLLKEIREQGKRIEQLSRVEHDLIREVHPQVNQIKEGVEAVADTVKQIPKPEATDR